MNSGKRIKHSVSLIVKDELGRYLVVKRPDDPADDLAGVWGFPAASAVDSESEKDVALRVGRAKLGVAVELGRKIGESTHERRHEIVHLVDYEARIVEGQVEVPQDDDSVTQYTDCMFTDDPTVVVQAARLGSQCTQIFLDDLQIPWRMNAAN